MSRADNAWFTARFSRLSTGPKMLLILSLALLPLGLIAILASLESARANSAESRSEVETVLELRAQRLDAAMARAALTIRAAGSGIELSEAGGAVCDQTLGRLARAQGSQWRYALFGPGGAIRCASPGYAPPPPSLLGPSKPGSTVEISDDGSALSFALLDADGLVEGAGEFPREILERITFVPGARDYDLELVDDRGRALLLHNGFMDGPLVDIVSATTPVIGGRMELRTRTGAIPVTAAEILIILLPVLMWLFASIIGWAIVDRVLLRPLIRMQRAVASYQPGDRGLDLPLLSTPAREIADLGAAFHEVTQTVARHEEDMEAAIERQSRLVREVHHRVKNNLQVVASLINLHARGAQSDDVAAAYASIMRRVDALAVVHRNHFAQFEDNRGVSLRTLISELCANLRATAPAPAANMQIRLDIAPLSASQDVAVSIAFLITEMVEFAMFCDAWSVAITLDREGSGSARLTIESEALGSKAECRQTGLAERFERIVTGLSRQLRSTLHRDTDAGRYALDIATLEQAERPDTDVAEPALDQPERSSSPRSPE